MTDSFVFDLTPIEIPVVVGQDKYVLREALEDVASKYYNARVYGTKVDDSKVVGLPEDLGGLQALLVSECLFRLKDDGTPFPNPVGRDLVNSWPSRIVKPLFVKAKEISELDDNDDLKVLKEQREELNKRIKTLEDEEEKTKNS